MYEVARSAGFKVLEFTDSPQYFRCWRLVLELGQHLYQLVSDGRESCLEIQKHNGADWQPVRYVGIANLSPEQELGLCSEWLALERIAAEAEAAQHGT